jgi:hypothetical protein
LYLGKAGQLAVMSYFLMRGWNVATPEVDVGDDLFVVDDKQGFFTRIQVKTAQAIVRENGFSARFNIPLEQLEKAIDPEIHYVFIVAHQGEWIGKIVISRYKLNEIYAFNNLGSLHGNNLMLYFSFQEGKVICSKIDVTEFSNNFSEFPIIEH